MASNPDLPDAATPGDEVALLRRRLERSRREQARLEALLEVRTAERDRARAELLRARTELLEKKREPRRLDRRQSSAISTATKDRIKVMYRLNSDEIGML